MAVIETKFSNGDVVWYAGTTTQVKMHDCPDCLGKRSWVAKSPAGNEYTFSCPRCSTSFSAHDDLNIRYIAHVPTARKLTIGSVRHESAGSFGAGPKTQYMCVETGVGSGSIYDENRLFLFEDEALECAQALADGCNATIPHIFESYNRSLSISDYQLENALIKNASTAASKARSMLWGLNDLFSSIKEADDKDQILELIEDYKRFSWERDKEEAA